MFYMCYTSRKHVQCNFLNNEWLRNLEISTLFMFAFYQLLKTDVECPHICEHCNKCIQPVTFVLFSSRLFSIRWQGLRIMKYKMDSHPQIKNDERSSHECVRPSVQRDFNLLFWDHYMTWRSSMSRWKLFCLSQAFHCELSFGNENSKKHCCTVYLFDLFDCHTCKYMHKSQASSFSFSPFLHLSADRLSVKKKCNFSADLFSDFH